MDNLLGRQDCALGLLSKPQRCPFVSYLWPQGYPRARIQASRFPMYPIPVLLKMPCSIAAGNPKLIILNFCKIRPKFFKQHVKDICSYSYSQKMLDWKFRSAKVQSQTIVMKYCPDVFWRYFFLFSTTYF